MQSVEEKLQKLQLQPAPSAPPPPPAVSDAEWMARKLDKDKRTKVRHKQQRLLLLHHASECPEEEGHCRMTPHCANMKRLWTHMEGCKDRLCLVQHCFSSRSLLGHYKRCKDDRCPVCGPVRPTARRHKQHMTVEP